MDIANPFFIFKKQQKGEKMFFTDGKLRGLEKFMQLPKYPTKRGGGKYRSSYHYTKGDCNCVNCLHWKKKYGCSQKVCPYIQERIDCGACSFDEILHAAFIDVNNKKLKSRINLYVKESKTMNVKFRNDKHKELFYKTIEGKYKTNNASLFTITPIELYKFCVTLQNTLSKDLTRIFASQQGTTLGEVALKTLQFAFFKDGAIVQAGLYELVAIIALGYCVVKIFFDNIKRGGILLVQIAVGSLYMFSIPRGYGEGFTQWMKQVIALCLTAFLQTTLLFLGLLTWTDNMLLAIGIMMAASEVPRIAERFGLDTSVKFNMMSAVHMTSTAVNLAKNIAK